MIGLTGPIGGGKSTALALFGELGAATLSSDDVVHRLYARSDVAERLRDRFGPDVVRADGSVDRAALAAIVFVDDDARRDLEALTHPLVAEAFSSWVLQAATAPLLVHEVPLLFEAGLQDRYDRTLVVTASPGVRRRRLGSSRPGFDLATREATQLPVAEKVRRADDAIVNDGSLDELRALIAAYAVSVGAPGSADPSAGAGLAPRRNRSTRP